MTKKKVVIIEKVTERAIDPKEVNINRKLPDNIDEYFVKVEGSKEAINSRELFQADERNVDIKTDLKWEEITLINKIIFHNELLKSKGLPGLYEHFLYHYMRLKISLDRKSRGEFVSINKTDKTDEALNLASNMSNITGGNVRR